MGFNGKVGINQRVSVSDENYQYWMFRPVVGKLWASDQLMAV